MVNFILVLSALVLFHELGHYLAARYFGVTVESFSIGLGPRLMGFKRKGTDFKICLLPLGGYVKMAGQFAAEGTKADPGDLVSKPRWQRLIVVGMGPAFNFLLAVVLLTGLYMLRYEKTLYLDLEPRVDYVAVGSPAAVAGVLAGDIVRSIDGAPTATWQELLLESAIASGREVDLAVERDGSERLLRIEIPGDDSLRDLGDPGWFSAHAVALGSVLPGSPAESAGLRQGDELVSVDGVRVVAVRQAIDLIGSSAGRALAIEVDRGGTPETLEARAARSADGGAWQVGVRLLARHERTQARLALVPAVARSLTDNVAFTGLIFRTVRALVVGNVSVEALEGPVGIYQHTQDAAARGTADLIYLMALISVNLAVLNLLPVPVLDGGQIVLLLVESLLRRDVSLEVKHRITQVGLAFIVILFGIVMYNDIARQFFPP